MPISDIDSSKIFVKLEKTVISFANGLDQDP